MNSGGITNSYEIGAHGIYALNFSTCPPGPPRRLTVTPPPMGCMSMRLKMRVLGTKTTLPSESNYLRVTWKAPLDAGQPGRLVGGWTHFVPLSHTLLPPIYVGKYTELTSYRIYRDGQLIHTTASASECSYIDNGILAGTSYVYSVTAVNSAGTLTRKKG